MKQLDQLSVVERQQKAALSPETQGCPLPVVLFQPVVVLVRKSPRLRVDQQLGSKGEVRSMQVVMLWRGWRGWAETRALLVVQREERRRRDSWRSW